VSSNDRSDHPGVPRRTSGKPGAAQNAKDSQWDIDPADIDRYLSGRPQRPTAPTQSTRRYRDAHRPQSAGTSTSDQLAQLRQMVNQETAARQRPQSAPSSGAARRASRLESTPARPSRVVRAEPAPTAPEPVHDYDYSAERERDRLLRHDPYVTERDDEFDDYDAYYDETDAFDDELIDERMATRGTRRSPSVPSMPKLSMPAMPRLTVPQSVSQAALFSDIVSLTLIGVGVLSLAAMAILVANRIGTLPESIPTHVSASGVLEQLRSRRALWNLPLLSTMLTLMNVVIALFVARIDRFASRFILGAALVVQFVAWVAVLRII